MPHRKKRQGPNVLVVEMQGLDIFDVLSTARREGVNETQEDGGDSSRGESDSSSDE